MGNEDDATPEAKEPQAEEHKPAEELTCFVVIGFGKKTDYSTGRTLDLDLTYTKLIKPAFDRVGIRCFRAIDVNVTGSIDKLMYHWIYHADFVVADLSTMNANVFYELGVRHAQCPNTTLIMAENGLFSKLPFDLSHTIIYGYEHLGDSIADEEATRFVDLLAGQLQKLLDEPVELDSPVYTYMPGMKAPEWVDRAKLIEDLEARLAAHEQAEASGEVDPGAVAQQSLALLVKQAEKAKNDNDFATAIALLETAAANDERDVFIRQRLALCTYKRTEKSDDDAAAIADLEAAEQILAVHCDLKRSTDPETLGLAGAINKRLYDRTGDTKYFDRSLYHYERGFYIKQDYYNGINVAFLYTKRAAEYAEAGDSFNAIVYYGHGNLIRERVAALCEELVDDDQFASRGDKQWIYMTLAEAYFGMGRDADAERQMPFIEKESQGAFDMDTFRAQNQQLVDAMKTFAKRVVVPGGAPAAKGPAPESAASVSEAPTAAASTVVETTPTVRRTPGGPISIDLGEHDDKPVKSIEVKCKIEFE